MRRLVQLFLGARDPPMITLPDVFLLGARREAVARPGLQRQRHTLASDIDALIGEFRELEEARRFLAGESADTAEPPKPVHAGH